MPIQFRCQKCSNEIRTPDGTAGKRAECPYCGEVMSIPSPLEESAAAPRQAPQPAKQAGKPHDAGDDCLRVEFPCPKCTRPVRTPASALGKRGKCPSCGAVIQLPQRAKTGTAKQLEKSKAVASTKQRKRTARAPSPIEFACPSCGKNVRTPASAAGKNGRCPKCGDVMQIPSTSQAKTAGREKLADAGRAQSRRASADATPGLEPIPGLTPVADSGLTPLPDTGSGLTPLPNAGAGLTPLPTDDGLTPLPTDDGLTPLGKGQGLTPWDSAPTSTHTFSTDHATTNPFAGPQASGTPLASPNPYQAPIYAGRRSSSPSRGVVMAPAIAMMIVIGLNVLFMLFLCIINVIDLGRQANLGPGRASLMSPDALVGFLSGLLCLAVYVLMFVGAYRMMRFRNWGLALTSAILMLIPCTMCWTGLPFGIWAIVVLSLQTTRDQFS